MSALPVPHLLSTGRLRYIEPSDAQQMLLEMVPDAMWTVLDVTEDFNPETLETRVAIRTSVTLLRVTEDANGTDVVIDVLNEDTRIEAIPV